MGDDARELFDQYSDPHTGFQAISLAVENDVREGLHIDFKGLKEGGQPILNGRFPQELRTKLAVLISAYANTSGGVIVWGVDCRPKKPMQAEPVPNCEALCEHMKALTQNIVDPITVVEHRLAIGPDGRGFIVTYIPQATRRPIMVVLNKENRYYLRTTDSCEPMHHGVVQALMNGRSSPNLKLVPGAPRARFLGLHEPHPAYSRRTADYEVFVELTLLNSGGAIARECAVLFSALPHNVHVDPLSGCRPPEVVKVEREGQVVDMTLYRPKDDRVFHPGIGMPFLRLGVTRQDLENVGMVWFDAQLVAEGFSQDFVLNVDMANPLDRQKSYDDKLDAEDEPNFQFANEIFD